MLIQTGWLKGDFFVVLMTRNEGAGKEESFTMMPEEIYGYSSDNPPRALVLQAFFFPFLSQ